MGITDELRNAAAEITKVALEGDHTSAWCKIDEIADEIEREHKDELLLYRNAGYNDGYDAGFASADDWYVDHAEELAEHGWVKLPVDADGEYVHVGDVMDCGEHFGIQEVEGFIHNAVAFTVCDPQPARICTCPAHMTRHHYEPTVEDVLVDFFKVCQTHASELGFCTDESKETAWRAIAADYAAKLQLREDA